MTFDPITKKPRKIPITMQEMANVRKGQSLCSRRPARKFDVSRDSLALYFLMVLLMQIRTGYPLWTLKED